MFFPDNLIATAPYTHLLQHDGIEVVFRTPDEPLSWREQFVELLAVADLVWVSRPDFCRKYLPIVRAHSKLPVLYDTIDLHHLRLRRQAEHDSAINAGIWQHVERIELSCARAADATIVVSDYEATILHSAGIDEVAIVPTIHDAAPHRERDFEETSGILFIGGYAHPPNIDAATWLIGTIMPLVWEQFPSIVVTLLGSHPPASIRELAGDRVVVPGFIPDVSAYFEAARIFVAPIRFGAGLKGKVGQALSFGLPVVTTSVAAEGFHLSDARHALIADEAASFANAIGRLYNDRVLWDRLANASSEALEAFSSKHVVANAIALMERTITLVKEQHG